MIQKLSIATSRYSVNVMIQKLTQNVQKLTQNVQVHSENGSDTPRGACGNQVNLSICRTTNAHFLRWGTSGGVYGPCIFTPMLAESYHRWLKVFANGFVWRLLGDNKLPCLLILFPSLLILHRHAVPSSGFSSSFCLFGGAWGWGRLEEREGKARGCKIVHMCVGGCEHVSTQGGWG